MTSAGRFAAFTQDEKDALAHALGEYVADRYGDSGAYLRADEGLDDLRVHMLAEVLRAGGEPDGYQRALATRVRRLVPRRLP